ncbi:MAG: amino acid ABC transporter substrate-binding protein [Actinomycetales bacterium]|nr:amino acid ABC transporter substrate-binding protein [Actinomycetales bacterium]
MRITTRITVLAAASALALAGCAGSGSTEPTPAPTTETPAASETAEPAAPALETVTDGKLTIGTSDPAYEPWVVDNDPTNGKGYESAVAYAVAEQLGFAAADVEWVAASFDQIIAPGVKNYDFAINQVSITDERKANIAFSSSYYDATQAVVTIEGSAAVGVTDIAGLKPLKIGAMVGTTSAAVVEATVQPENAISLFNDNDQAKQALASGLVDVVVFDLPTALYVTAVELEGGTFIGQLPAGDNPDQFGLVLDLESPNVDAVTAAVDALRADGTLADLEAQWLTDTAGVPVLQ